MVAGVAAVGGAEGVVVDVVGTVVLGVVDVVAVDVFDEIEVPEGVDVPDEVEVLVVVAGGADVPDVADVDAAGGELVMGAATGFFMPAECTGRRCCPFGPVAEATAPKLMVAASAAAAPARKYVRGTCRIIPLLAPGVGPLGRELRDDRDFGGSANSESPVALRPPLARGLPFSTAFNNDLDGFISTSQWIRSYQRLLQPTGNRFTTQTWFSGCDWPKRHPNLGWSPINRNVGSSEEFRGQEDCCYVVVPWCVPNLHQFTTRTRVHSHSQSQRSKQ